MATRYWLGSATVVRDQLRWTVAGTWVAGDTITFTINNKALMLTVGTTVTIDQILADLVDMINGADANGDETRSALGTAVGEFANIAASANTTTDKITLLGDAYGRPMGTVTATKSSTSGTITSDGTGTIAASSPNHFSTAANWSGNAVPVDSDDVVFDNKAVASCLYGLTPASLTPATLTITNGFRYSIGLPAVNASQSVSFDEHLSTYLVLDGATTTIIDAPNANKIKIDFGSTLSAIVVRNTGQTDEPNTPPCLIKANVNTSTLTVEGGRVGVNYEPKTTGSLASVFVNGQSPTVDIGNTTTLPILNVSSGTVTCESTVTTIKVTGGSLSYSGGTVTTLTIDGGVFTQVGTGTVTTCYLVGGTLDCSVNSRARTITNFSMYAKTALLDPLGTITFTNGIDLFCKPQDVVLDLPSRKTYSLSDV